MKEIYHEKEWDEICKLLSSDDKEDWIKAYDIVLFLKYPDLGGKDLLIEKCTDIRLFQTLAYLRGLTKEEEKEIEWEVARRRGLTSKIPGWEKIEEIAEEDKEE